MRSTTSVVNVYIGEGSRHRCIDMGVYQTTEDQERKVYDQRDRVWVVEFYGTL